MDRAVEDRSVKTEPSSDFSSSSLNRMKGRLICTKWCHLAGLMVLGSLILTPTIFFVIPVSTPASNTTNDSTWEGHKTVVSTNGTGLNNASCHPDLKQRSDGTCYLECGRWTFLPSMEERFVTILVYIEMVLYTVSGLMVCMVWLKLRHVLWKFPHILSLYMMLTFLAMGIINAVVLFTGSSDYMCSSDDLFESIYNPTLLCTVGGAVYQYVKLVFVSWWVVATGNLWWIVRRPAKAHLLFENKSRLHAGQTAVCLLLPGLLVGLVFALDDQMYFAYDSGAVCSPSGKITGYFTFILPMQVGTFIMVIFLIDVAFGLTKAVHRRQRLEQDSFKEGSISGRKSSRRSNSSIPTKDMRDLRHRFLTLALAMPLLFTLVFTHYVLKIRNVDSVKRRIKEFYSCLLEHPEGGICPETYKDLQHPILAVASHCTFIILCLLLLVFIFTIKDAREALLKKAASFLQWLSCYKQNLDLQTDTVGTKCTDHSVEFEVC